MTDFVAEFKDFGGPELKTFCVFILAPDETCSVTHQKN